MLTRLDKEQAYVHKMKFLPVSELQRWSTDVLDILQQSKVVEVRNDEFGDQEVALCVAQVVHLKQVAMTSAMHSLAIPCEASGKKHKGYLA